MRYSVANHRAQRSVAVPRRILRFFAGIRLLSCRMRRILGPLVLLAFQPLQVAAADPQMGDLDGDGRITVLDVARVVILSRTGTAGVSPQTIATADVNQDGAVNDTDAELIAEAAVGLRVLPKLPLDTIRGSSPAPGEDGVAVTRESVFYLTMPLADGAVVNTNNLHATFAGRQILSRAEVASDRRTVTLFYLEPLPGSAQVHVTFDGAGLTDFLGRPVDLDGDGVSGGIATLDFGTLSLTAVTNTAVVGRVFASEIRVAGTGATNTVMDTPIVGVTITVDGMEQSMRTITDAQGNFRLNPVPAGAFFVHIDGRTVTNLAAGIRYSDLSYYPFVGKRWVSVAGQETSIGDVFLPLIVASTLQTTTSGVPTTVKFPTAVVAQNPALANVSLQVPADDLFREDGTRGGRIGIAPVPADRLPGPLPTGVSPALVITIQTDGAANFDKPVPACFPNLPDPTTGQKLAPGEKSALWSFNHDTGRFEIVGSATVSDDGTLVCSDPGVGILAPGWHFVAQGTRGTFSGTDCDPSGAKSRNEPGTQSRTPGKPGKGPCDPPRAGGGGGRAGDPIQLFSGEMIEEDVDLRILGRGVDFIWQRTYRSQTGPITEQGNGWDHPYHIYLETTGTNLTLHDGNGRGDLYLQQADGTWTRAEFFRVITREADGSYTVTFEDKGRWGFYPLDGTPKGGRIAFSEDRNSNRMSFAYGAQGRLAVVNDTLGRDITIAYNSDGFIQSITDFTGRTVRYEYYQSGDADGGFGDLKSVTGPAVINTPNGNDFPTGKTTTYTYSTGFADERLNHNLLTVTDGRRNDPNDPTFGTGPYLVNIYSTATDPNDPQFDHVVRQIWGGGVIDFVYMPLLPSAPNGFAVMRTIVNDRVGNVTEHFFDDRNREVRTRQYTGRAIPDQPTTALDNRPQNRLRASDPDYFETIFEWTDDSLQRRVIHPNGNITEYVYETDVNPSASARTRGNVRTIRHLPGTHLPAGDQPIIEEGYEYDTDFASCCGFNFVTKETNGRGNSIQYQYDSRGNRIRSIHAIPSVVDEWEYNQFGQLTAHVLPPDPSGVRRRDEQIYYDSGAQKGYLKQSVRDANGLRIATTFEYNSVGVPVRVIDPNGHDTQRVVNELNQMVRFISPEVTTGSGIRYQVNYFYDANDNLVRQDTKNLDENGVVQPNSDFTATFDYDVLNMPVRLSQEIDESHSAVTEFAYDGNRNRILTRQPEAVNGHQPANVIRMAYDERDMLFQVAGASGDAAQSTSQTDYDLNGNRIRVLEGIEAGARITTFEYDGYDRLVTVMDAMGNRRRLQFDAAHNVVHGLSEGELADLPGLSNNVRLAEFTRTLDPMNRVVQVDAAYFDPASQQPIGDGHSLTSYEFAPNSVPTRIVNDNNHDVRFQYDSAHRLIATLDAKGDSFSRVYDANGNPIATTELEKSDLGGTDASFTSHFVFDNLNRLVQVTDPGGNINQFAYDSRNNKVVMLDAARTSSGAPGNRSRTVYDGLSRATQMIRELTSDGTGAGSPAGQIVLRREWDDDSRPTAAFDGNGNATRYTYDPLDRLTRATIASGATKSIQYDAHSDALSVTDPNGTNIRQTFDTLDRLVRRDVTPGPGVASDTTFEDWSYDGLSRMARAANDSAQVTKTFDSLGNVTREAINGAGVESAYDGIGNAISIKYPGGRKIALGFDALEQLKSISDATGAATANIAAFDYAGPRRIARRLNGNNTRLDQVFDSVKRLTRSTHAVVGGTAFDDREFGWDANSNQTFDRDNLAGGISQSYGYDSMYRLAAVQLTGGLNEQRSYHWDAAGNRLAVTGNGDAGNYALAGGTSADSVLNQYTSTPFDQRQYDPNGNLTEITSAGQPRKLAFDYLNRLVRLEQSGVTNRYIYDPLGRRVARINGSGPAGTTRYFYRGFRAIEEQDGAGTTLATYVFGPALNDVVSMQRAGKNYWLHADDKLSVRRITDASGKVVEGYAYDEFGSPAILDGTGQALASSAVGNPYLFTGYRYDAESGFYYANQRYYEPRSGRFISRDPAGAFADGMAAGNAFAYAGNNPATFVDPAGLSALKGAIPTARDVLATSSGTASKIVKNGNSYLTEGGQLLSQSRQLANEATAATAEAERISSTFGNEMMTWFAAAEKEGILINDIGLSGTENVSLVMQGGVIVKDSGDTDLLRRTFSSDEEIAQFLNEKAVNQQWMQDTAERAQALEDRAAQLQQRAAQLESEGAALVKKGSKLKTAGKVLGYAGAAVQTAVAMKDAYDPCQSLKDQDIRFWNEGAATGAANLIVMSAPPLGALDLVTGGSVTTGLHNVMMAPTVVSHMAGRMTSRDADGIKSSMTGNWVTRQLWSAGEWIAGD